MVPGADAGLGAALLSGRGRAPRVGNKYLTKTEISVLLDMDRQNIEPPCTTNPSLPPNGRASALPAKSCARCRSGGGRPILTCWCLVTALSRLRAIHRKVTATVRRALGQALAKRRLDAPEDYARIQVARLTKALRCADASLEEGDLKAIVPLLKVVRELNLYHGVTVGSARPAPAALPELAQTSPLALTHSPGVALTEACEDEKSCTKAQLSI